MIHDLGKRKERRTLQIPIDGLFSMLVQLSQAQETPLTFPSEWKKGDALSVFFNTLVDQGIAKWKEPKIITPLEGAGDVRTGIV